MRLFAFRKTVGLVLFSLLLSLVGVIGSTGTAYAYDITCGYYGQKPSFACVNYTGYTGQQPWGYPVDANGHNCTNYVTYRLWQNGVPNPGNLGDAKDWDENATAYGIPVNNTPAVGAVAVWEAYSGPALADGHVAYVEAVTSTYIDISEDNYGGTTMRKRFYVGQSGWPDHFIHFKDLSSSPPTTSPWTGVGNATFLGNQLTTGQQMHGNQYIMSPGGRFVLMMQTDGNLAEYTSTGAIWSTGTGGNSGAWLGVQSDGNVVLYSASGTALWDTGGLGITKFAVQDDENVVGYNTAGQAAWSTGITTSSGGWTSRGSDSLSTGTTMTSNQYLQSADGRYHVLMQSDGNLVVYAPGYMVVWSSSTGGNPGAYVVVQSDGNVVIYASGGTTALWDSQTAGSYTGIARLTIQSDGRFLGFSSVNTLQWNTGTWVGNPWPGIGNATFLGNQLTAGQQMQANQYITSPDGRFVLVMQPDGNLVEYTTSGSIWWSGTTGNSGAYVVVQSDGNVVIYASNGTTALWDTGGLGVSKLVIQNDEDVVAYTASGTAAWASGYSTSTLGLSAQGTDNLTPGETLTSGQYLRSADGRYTALMQSDGNFVVYAPGYRVLWNSQTGNQGAYLDVLSTDNVVIYASDGTTLLWGISQGGITKFVMQSDGNLVAYDATGTAVWYTGTSGAT